MNISQQFSMVCVGSSTWSVLCLFHFLDIGWNDICWSVECVLVLGAWAGEGKESTGEPGWGTEGSDRRAGRRGASVRGRQAPSGGEHAGTEGADWTWSSEQRGAGWRRQARSAQTGLWRCSPLIVACTTKTWHKIFQRLLENADAIMA